MKIFRMAAFLILNVVMCVSITYAAEGLEQVDFSAEMVFKSQKIVYEGKIYVSNKKSRMENPKIINIARPDLNVAWTLLPKQKMYIEITFGVASFPKTYYQLPGEIERIEMGVETVDGKQAKKFEVTYTEGGRQDSIYQWMADGIPIPLKMESLDDSWSVEYRNVHVGPQPDAIFEVPPDYQKMAMTNQNDIMAQALRIVSDE